MSEDARDVDGSNVVVEGLLELSETVRSDDESTISIGEISVDEYFNGYDGYTSTGVAAPNASASTSSFNYGASSSGNGYGGASSFGNGYGGASSSSNGYGGASSSGNSYGGASSSGNSYGGASSSGNDYGGASSSGNGYGGASSSGNSYGGASSSGNGYGGASSSGNGYGGASSSDGAGTSSSGNGDGGASSSGNGDGGASSSGNGGGASSSGGAGTSSYANGSGVSSIEFVANVAKLSHTSIMKPAASAKQIPVQYSTPKPRAAAIKATEAIAKCCPKKKRRKTAEQKTEKPKVEFIEEPELEDFGVKLSIILYRNFMLDRNIMCQPKNYLITSLPAKPSVYDFLTDFTKKKNVHVGIAEYLMELFDKTLPGHVLDYIEKLQFENLPTKYPNRPMHKIYGIIHFTRFLMYLPEILKLTTKTALVFTEWLTPFINEFLDYMEEQELEVNFDLHYEHVMPDYYRMTFWPLRNKQLYRPYRETTS